MTIENGTMQRKFFCQLSRFRNQRHAPARWICNPKVGSYDLLAVKAGQFSGFLSAARSCSAHHTAGRNHRGNGLRDRGLSTRPTLQRGLRAYYLQRTTFGLRADNRKLAALDLIFGRSILGYAKSASAHFLVEQG